MLYRIPISIEKLEVGMINADPIFTFNERGQEAMLLPAEARFTDAVINQVRKHNIKVITILSDKPPEPKPQKIHSDPEPIPVAVDNLPIPPAAPAVLTRIGDKPPVLRTVSEIGDDLYFPRVEPMLDEKLQQKALENVKEMYAVAAGSSMTTAHQAVKELDNTVERLVDAVASDTSGLVHLTHLRSYDEYTYHHSLSVALLSVAIGHEMGIDKWELKRLGKGAILHDIGKVMVPINVLNKSTRLSSEEFDIMKSHSEKGAKYLQINGIGDGGIWEVVLCHHEKVDGTGYPKGMKGNEIPLFARITTMADVYDALTSYRPYREPMSPSTAFEVISGDVGRIFDYDVVSAFMKKIDLYPVNTIVELSNKKRAIIVESNYNLRPVIKMLDDGQLLDLSGRRNLNLVIERVCE